MSGKRLLGFLPTISVLTKYKGNARLAVYKRKLMRKAMAHITSQITEVVNSYERGLTIIVRGKGTLSIGHFHVHIFHFSDSPPYDVQQFWSQHAEPNALLYVPGLNVTN